MGMYGMGYNMPMGSALGGFGNVYSGINYPTAQAGFGMPSAMATQQALPLSGLMSGPVMTLQSGFQSSQFAGTYYPTPAEIGISNPFAGLPGEASMSAMSAGYPSAANGGFSPTAMAIPGLSGMTNAGGGMMAQNPFQSPNLSLTYNVAPQPRKTTQADVDMVAMMRDPEMALMVKAMEILHEDKMQSATPADSWGSGGPMSGENGAMTDSPSIESSLNPTGPFSQQPYAQPPYSSSSTSSPYGDPYGLFANPSSYDAAYSSPEYGVSTSLYNSSPLDQAMQTYRSTFSPDFGSSGQSPSTGSTSVPPGSTPTDPTSPDPSSTTTSTGSTDTTGTTSTTSTSGTTTDTTGGTTTDTTGGTTSGTTDSGTSGASGAAAPTA